MRRLRQHQITAMMWYYSACKRFLACKFPLVFAGGSRSSADPFHSFMLLTSNLAGADPTKMEQVRQASLYDTMTSLQQMLKQDKAARDSIEKMKYRR